jgi:predicted nucleic acid-binding Zn ribbon protein
MTGRRDEHEEDGTDEGPSSEDVRRFAAGEAFCPDCGAEIHDQAEVCPKCYAYLAGETSRFRPAERDLRGRFIALTVVALILVLLGWGLW